MSFATVGIGTDTVNSIRSPASANCVGGLRPTRSLVSRSGVIPVSSTQDCVGLIAPPFRDLDTYVARGNYERVTLEAFLEQARTVVNANDDKEYLSRLVSIGRLRNRVYGLMAAHALDVLAYPLQKCLVVPVGSPGQRGRNGILAGLTGFPAMTVPMGFSKPTESAPLGVPIGLVLGAFFWTYSLMQIPGGWLADKCGAKKVIAVSMSGLHWSTPSIVGTHRSVGTVGGIMTLGVHLIRTVFCEHSSLAPRLDP